MKKFLLKYSLDEYECDINWYKRFLKLSRFISKFSKDPSTKVGAVIADDMKRIVSIGYNGFPRGIQDDNRLEDRQKKYKIIVHAEANALLNANKSCEGCTLFTWPFQPCSNCASLIIQSGIKIVVSKENNVKRWKDNFELSAEILLEAGIKILLCDNKYNFYKLDYVWY